MMYGLLRIKLWSRDTFGNINLYINIRIQLLRKKNAKTEN